MTTKEIRATFDLKLMIQIGTMLVGALAIWFGMQQRVAVMEERLTQAAVERVRLADEVSRIRATEQATSNRLTVLETKLDGIGRTLDKVADKLDAR